MIFSGKTLEIVNCKQSFEGVFQFSYEVDFGGGGICDNPNSIIKACQEPGSPYVDNQVFQMDFARCSDVTSSSNKSKYIVAISQLLCLKYKLIK